MVPIVSAEGELLQWEPIIRAKRVALLAPRGGGKTQLMGGVGYPLWRRGRFDVIHLGGSLDQSLEGYSYFSELRDQDAELHPFLLKDNITYTAYWSGRGPKPRVRRLEEAEEEEQPGRVWYRCLPASTKAVRGKHAGGKSHEVRGGLLILDEEAEMDERIVRAAKFTINTADPDVVVRGSTAHKPTGTFAKLIEDATPYEEWIKLAPEVQLRTYVLIHWDAFDSAEPCPYAKGDRRRCQKRCPAPEPFWERKDEEGETVPGYCHGKAAYVADDDRMAAWLRIDRLAEDWRDVDIETFEVEAMGLRPSQEGVAYKTWLIDRAFAKPILYRGGESWLGIDWGYGEAVALWYQWGPKNEHGEPTVEVYDAWTFNNKTDSQIIAALRGPTTDWEEMAQAEEGEEPPSWLAARQVGIAYCDAENASGNAELEQHIRVRRVPFGAPVRGRKGQGSTKEAHLVPQSRNLLEKGRIRVTPEADHFRRQWRGLKLDDKGHIVKKDDHAPDANLCGIVHAVGLKPRTRTRAVVSVLRDKGGRVLEVSDVGGRKPPAGVEVEDAGERAEPAGVLDTSGKRMAGKRRRGVVRDTRRRKPDEDDLLARMRDQPEAFPRVDKGEGGPGATRRSEIGPKGKLLYHEFLGAARARGIVIEDKSMVEELFAAHCLTNALMDSKSYEKWMAILREVV